MRGLKNKSLNYIDGKYRMHAIVILLTCILAIAGVQTGYLIADAQRAQKQNHLSIKGPSSIERHPNALVHNQPYKRLVNESTNKTQNRRYTVKKAFEKRKFANENDALFLASKSIKINIPSKEFKLNMNESLQDNAHPDNRKQALLNKINGEHHFKNSDKKHDLISVYISQNKSKIDAILQMLHLKVQLDHHKEVTTEESPIMKSKKIEADRLESQNYVERLEKKLSKSNKSNSEIKSKESELNLHKPNHSNKMVKKNEKHNKRKIYWSNKHGKHHSNERKKHGHEECSFNKTCSKDRCCVERRNSEWVCVDKGTRSIDQKCLDTCMCRKGFTCFSFINSHKDTKVENASKSSGQCISEIQIKNHKGFILDQSKNLKNSSKFLKTSSNYDLS